MNGKGSARRPTRVSRQELEAAWARTFETCTCAWVKVGDVLYHGTDCTRQIRPKTH